MCVCMYVCMYIYIYIYTYIHMYIGNLEFSSLEMPIQSDVREEGVVLLEGSLFCLLRLLVYT